MYVLTVISQKGGSGKTTTALALAAALRAKKKKVLLVDLDSQGNLSFGVNADTSAPGSLGAMTEPGNAAEYIEHKEGSCDVLAGCPALAVANAQFNVEDAPRRLSSALETLKDKYDYVIVDTPPSIGFMSTNALVAADGVIIPTQADFFGVQGILKLKTTIDTAKKANPKLTVLGILMVRVKKNTNLCRNVSIMLDQAAEQFDAKLFKTQIRDSVVAQDAVARQMDIYVYAPKSGVAADYEALVKEVLSRIRKTSTKN